MRKIGFLFICGFLAACANSQGPKYSETPAVTADKGSALVIIYHPNEFIGSAGGAPNVKINGNIVCELANGNFFMKPIAVGPTEISSTKMLSIGTSILSLDAKPGKTYYVRITWNSGKVWSTGVGGLLGEGIAEGVSNHSGPFLIETVNKLSAEEELGPLRKGC